MKCPGQDPRFWKFDAIFETQCPNCGAVVEFFKDESRRKCPKCGHRTLNPKMDFGCAVHCKFAEQCFGDLPPELLEKKKDLFKDRVAVEMKMFYKADFKRIGHAARTARHAQTLAKEEKGDPAVVLSAAYLYDVGLKAAETAPANSHEPDIRNLGAAVAREILTKLDGAESFIEAVCEIIANRGGMNGDSSTNAGIVHDADIIARLEELNKKSPLDPETIARETAGLLTESAKELVKTVLSGPSADAA